MSVVPLFRRTSCLLASCKRNFLTRSFIEDEKIVSTRDKVVTTSEPSTKTHLRNLFHTKGVKYMSSEDIERLIFLSDNEEDMKLLIEIFNCAKNQKFKRQAIFEDTYECFLSLCVSKGNVEAALKTFKLVDPVTVTPAMARRIYFLLYEAKHYDDIIDLYEKSDLSIRPSNLEVVYYILALYHKGCNEDYTKMKSNAKVQSQMKDLSLLLYCWFATVKGDVDHAKELITKCNFKTDTQPDVTLLESFIALKHDRDIEGSIKKLQDLAAHKETPCFFVPLELMTELQEIVEKSENEELDSSFKHLCQELEGSNATLANKSMEDIILRPLPRNQLA